MKLTRQQKVGFAVVALGACAVLVDRVFLLGPAEASAGSMMSSMDDAANGTPGVRGGAGRMPLTLAMTNQPRPVADVLESIRQEWSLGSEDADAGFPVEIYEPLAAESAAEPVAQVVAEADAADDMPELTVTSMLDGARPLAVINGRAYTVGDELLGVQVVRIANGRVAFLHGRHLFEVAVERQDGR